MTQITEKQKPYDQTSGGLFFAKVVSSDAGTYTIQVAPLGKTTSTLQATPLSGIFSHFLGFKDCNLPIVGSDVLCFQHDTYGCVSLGTLPKNDSQSAESSYPRRSLLGGGDGINDQQNTIGYVGDSIGTFKLKNNNRPTDVVEGDYVVANDFGILLGLFQQFATLKASELSQIQCHVLDDLVRIVSHNFQHYTALGQYNVFHDGQGLHVEFGATHDPRESIGQPQTSLNSKNSFEDTKTNAIDDSTNFIKLKDNERLTSIERFKGFVGALGDFVQLMLVRPAEGELRAVDGVIPKTPDKGLFNLHISQDGGFHLRSAKGIFFEKTNWIRVPHRIRTPEDPEGDDAVTLKLPQKEDFEFNRDFQFQNNPYLYYLQIRDYLAYVQEELAYSSFKAHEKDIFVNDDFKHETQDNTIASTHYRNTTKLEPRVSGCYMMPNGGIVFKDAWGSAIVMEGGNISIQPAKDLVMQPLRNLVGKVGRFTSIASNFDIDLSSTRGGYRLKTDKSQYNYSESSGIILHANTKLAADFAPKDGAIDQLCGVVLLAPEAGIFEYGKYKHKRILENDSSLCKIGVHEAENILHLFSDKTLSLLSTESTLLTSESSLIATARGSAIFMGDKNTLIGKKDQTHAVAKGPLVQGMLEDDKVDDLLDKLDDLAELKAQKVTSNFRKDEDWVGLKFRFLKTEQYTLDPNEDKYGETIAQQEDEMFHNHGLKTWTELPVNGTLPFPGSDFKNSKVTSAIANLERIDNILVNKPSHLAAKTILVTNDDIFVQKVRV